MDFFDDSENWGKSDIKHGKFVNYSGMISLL